MFLKTEGDALINLMQVTRVELCHGAHQKLARLYGASGLLAESSMAYAYFANPANADFLYVRERAEEVPA